MKFSLRNGLLLGLLIAALPLCLSLIAQTNGKTDGAVAVQMTTQLFCGVFYLLGGKVGLLLGFSVAIYGLYLLVESGNMRGIYIIVCGAMITALPGLVVTGIQGAAAFMQSTGISSSTSFSVPKC